ncbi:glycoside hydrolase family 3 protein [Rhodotorula diobovata]|uniref:beta-glucosidase n=1 Tax=Rhodotorula diobovata TaxID=5288 RepID=A0A5C5FSE7_9BASI|nr:glycoside hydrolase family 3 protein [Rhodotorula diobovata]
MVNAPPSQFKRFDVDQKLAELSIATKIKLLGGKDFWCFEDSPEDGIPAVRTSDGPNGVRGRNFFNGVPSSCFPSGTGLAASFDRAMMRRVGEALGDECRAKSAHVLLGPTINIQRSPLGGRGFESYSEDPLLSGLLAAEYVNGVQSKGVAACIKHFVANDQEFERFSSDSVVSQRALREIYLEPFRLAVKHSSPKSFMTSYNRLNGTHCSEHKELLDGILRGEWGWNGLVCSDWTGVVSVDESIKAGLDVEMPGPPVMRGKPVNRALGAGKLTLEDIDDRARNVLELVNHAIDSGIPFYAGEDKVDTPELRALLREAAANATVLLKNDMNLLPLDASSIKGKRIAVVGLNAKVAFPSGGGSASLAPSWLVSALDGVTEAAEEFGATVEYTAGVAAFRYVPLLDPYLTHPTTGKQGALIEFRNGKPDEQWFKSADVPKSSKPDWSTDTNTSLCFMIDGVPWSKLDKHVRSRYVATFTPDQSGKWTFGLGSIGWSQLFLDGKPIVENVESYAPGELFFNMGSQERRGEIEVVAGQSYQLELHGYVDPASLGASPFTFSSSFRIGAFPTVEPEAARKEAADLAANCDVAIVVVGTNPDWESEGFDRKTMKLPGDSDELVRAVLAANPSTVVVNQSGTPVEFPWVKEASTVVQTFFGGNELGHGIADVLFGKVNPSGKLPLTFPVRLEDNPAYHSFGLTSETPGKVVYGEGIYTGYRHYDRLQVAPAFPFGHGLSYTTFKLSSLSTSPVSDDGDLTVSFEVQNAGKLDGAEVAQVYIAAPADGSRITSPRKELKAFEKVALRAGETKKVEVKLSREAFSYWNERYSKWVAPKGEYEVLVSTSSADKDIKLRGPVSLPTEIRWSGL